MKKVAAIQSNYIPWKGYFDIINAVDEFILYDDVQYTPKNWRNRNQLKTPQGLKWLTIPVKPIHDVPMQERMINMMVATDNKWQDKHWAFIKANYGKTRYFKLYRDFLEDAYLQSKSMLYLSRINWHFISKICELLDINTKITFSSDYQLHESGKSDRPLELALKSGCTHYVSGTTARDYYDLEKWHEAGITVQFFEYAGYREYWQPYPPFTHYVSALDLLFNTGEKAKEFLLTYE